jgi:hypothetical protein
MWHRIIKNIPPFKGTVSREWTFFERLKVLISKFKVCADGFPGHLTASHHVIQISTFSLLFSNILTQASYIIFKTNDELWTDQQLALPL